jgi:hypothetical protein
MTTAERLAWHTAERSRSAIAARKREWKNFISKIRAGVVDLSSKESSGPVDGLVPELVFRRRSHPIEKIAMTGRTKVEMGCISDWDAFN